MNTIDHLGTVSYNLEAVLSLQFREISSTGIRVASLAEVFNEVPYPQQRFKLFLLDIHASTVAI